MRLNRFPLVFLGALSLTGCTALSTGNVAPTNGQAVLEVRPQIQAGGYAVQSTIDPYGDADINHLLIKVYTVADATESPVLGANSAQVQKDIPNGTFNAPIVFNHLALNTHYRIRAYAYKDSGTADLISTKDANSYTDIVMVNDDRPNVTSLKVQLVDRIFNGQATASGVVISNGHVVSTATETLDVSIPD